MPDSGAGYGIAVNSLGLIYVTGQATFTGNAVKNRITNGDPIQRKKDAFVVQIDPFKSGAASLASYTVIGSVGDDIGKRIVVDTAGNAVVVGTTESANLPVTASAFQSLPGGNGKKDAFILRLNPRQTGSAALLYATYLGGSNDDECNAVILDSLGKVLITGKTVSTNFPNVGIAAFPPPSGSGNTARTFLTKLDLTQAGVASIVYSQYLSDEASDFSGEGIAVDGSDSVYVLQTGSVYSAVDQAFFPRTVYLSTYRASDLARITSERLLSAFSTEADYGAGLAVTPGGVAYATGFTFGRWAASTGAYQESYQGNRDGFVVKKEMIDPPTCDDGGGTTDAIAANRTGLNATSQRAKSEAVCTIPTTLNPVIFTHGISAGRLDEDGDPTKNAWPENSTASSVKAKMIDLNSNLRATDAIRFFTVKNLCTRQKMKNLLPEQRVMIYAKYE